MAMRWTILLAVATLMLPACGNDDPSPPATDPFLATLQGTWLGSCRTSSTDYIDEMTFSGTTVDGVTTNFATADGSCGGTATSTNTFTATFVLGGEVPATINVTGIAVTARAVDVTMDGLTFYTIVYVDTAATPDRLHLGDDPFPGDPAHDGSTPEKRHVILQREPMLKQ